jgi:hypothetical protein
MSKIPHGRVNFKVNDLLRITRRNVKFAKGYEQNFSIEIFRVVKVILHESQLVYELPDLNDHPTECQFYNYELVIASVSPQTFSNR